MKDLISKKKCILTVGIIGKNNGQTIEKCFQSLMPLKEAVDSEIIYTDTGSTDNSLEIAQKYVDKTINFTWNDDFAAARNTAIEVAQGEWFMWVDTDEYFDQSISNLIDFFNSGEHKKYRSAQLKRKELLSLKTNTNYVISNIHRLSVLEDENTRFKYRIHEAIPSKLPMKNLDVLLEHTGYLMEDEVIANEKQKRNIKILQKEMIERTGIEKLRTIYLLQKSFMIIKSYEEVNQLSKLGIKIYNEDKKINKNIYGKLYYYAYLLFNISIMIKNGEYNNAKKEISKLEISDNRLGFMLCDKYFFMYLIGEGLSEKDYKINGAKLFLKEIQKYDNLENTDFVTMYNVVSNTLENKFAISEFLLKLSLENNKQDEFQKYLNYLEDKRIIFENPIFLQKYFEILFLSAKEYKDFEIVAQKYDYYKNETQINLKKIRVIIENLSREFEAEKNLAEKFSTFKAKDHKDPFEQLFVIRKLSLEGNCEQISNNISTLLKFDLKNDSEIFSDLLYFGYKFSPELIDEIINSLGIDFSKSLKNALAKHLELADLVVQSINKEDIKNMSLKKMHLDITIIENVLNQNNGKDLIDTIENLVPLYLNRVYKNEVFKEENIFVLSPVLKFGYYINQAKQNRKENNLENAIINFKKAIIACYFMKPTIDIIINEIMTQIDTQNKNSNEFAQLAVKIKITIKQLLDSSKYSEALGVIDQLIKLIPQDQELIETKNKILNLIEK